MAKSIDCTPNWVGLYKWFLHMKKTDPKTFNRMVKKMGDEWTKLEKLAQALMIEEFRDYTCK